MAWTEITRPQYRRAGLRYASDLTDAEWAMIVPFMPERRRFGRRRSTKLRAVVEAMFYIASTGCQWRQLPKDFPPYSTVQGYFYAWVLDGRWELINHAPVMASREKAGRQASPTAGVIDSQSVKTTESGGPRGFDAGKKIMGRKRHILTDTAGHLVGLIVHIASIQDRDGAVAVLTSIRRLYPWLRHIFADGGYAGDKLRHALLAFGRWTVQIIKRSDAAEGSKSHRDAGSSSARLHGSGDAAGSRRTSKRTWQVRQRRRLLLMSGALPALWQDYDIKEPILSRTLRAPQHTRQKTDNLTPPGIDHPLIPNSSVIGATEAFNLCNSVRTACLVLAEQWRTWPRARPTADGNIRHHQIPGLDS